MNSKTQNLYKEINLYIEKERIYIGKINKLRLTRNISIGIGTIFAIIAIAK